MVRELTPTYAKTVELSVEEAPFPATKAKWQKHVPKGSHGLITFDAAGKVVDHIEGHLFSKDDIVAKLDAVK